MAKKKNSIALFEVIQKTRRGELEVPTWMGSHEPPPGAAPQTSAPPAPRAVRAPAEPVVRAAGERIRVSMSYVQCVVAGLGAAGLLVATYALGVWGGARSAKQPSEGQTLSGKTPLGTHVVPGGAGGPSGRTPPTPAAATGRQEGKHYLVIQALTGGAQADLAEATRIADWCKSRGEAATVARYTPPRANTQRYIVWSLKPFDSAGSADAQAHARKIEELGKEYFAKYRTYDFRQRSAGSKFEPWFERYNKSR